MMVGVDVDDTVVRSRTPSAPFRSHARPKTMSPLFGLIQFRQGQGDGVADFQGAHDRDRGPSSDLTEQAVNVDILQHDTPERLTEEGIITAMNLDMAADIAACR